MQMMANINKKMDLGWKMTTAPCPICNSTTFAEPAKDLVELYCPKCDKIHPF